MESSTSGNKLFSPWQLGGLIAVFVLFGLALLLPSKILSLFFLIGLMVYSIFFPKKALLFLIVYLPARSFIVEVNPTLKIVEEVVLFSGFLHVVYLNRKNFVSLFHFQLFELGFFAFLLIGAVSAHFGGISLGAIVTEVRAFLLTYVAFYVIKRLSIQKDDLRIYLWTSFIIAFVLSIFGIIEKVGDKSILFPKQWESLRDNTTNGERVYGLTDNPNVLATFLMITLIFSFYLKQFLSGWKKWLVYIGMVVIGCTTFLTYSRGTFLSFIIGYAVFLLWKENRKKALWFLLPLVFSFVVAFGVINPISNQFGFSSSNNVSNHHTAVKTKKNQSNQKNRILSTFSSSTIGTSSSFGRLFIVKTGLDIFKHHPVIGSGFGTFGDSASQTYTSPLYKHYHIGESIYSDDQYIEIIAETGVLGTIAFAIFLLSALVLVFKNRKNTYGVFILSFFIAVLFSSFVYNSWEDKVLSFFVFGLLGIFLPNKLNKKEK